MTKTKAQLRAEAVDRLRKLPPMDTSEIRYVRAILGSVAGMTAQDVMRELIDLLTDDCGPCYSCAKLAELRAENNALRVRLEDAECDCVTCDAKPTFDAPLYGWREGEADSREKLEADVRRDFATQDIVTILGWLDRQAAITERHILTHPDERDEQIAELCEDVAERDDVITVLKAENAELQREVDRLTRENISLARDLGLARDLAERDGLKAENKLLRERKCPGYEPERHYCRYHHQDFELNDRTVSELKRRVSQLEDSNAALERELKLARGELSVTLNNWEQAKGKIRREKEELANRRKKLDELAANPEGPLHAKIERLEERCAKLEAERDSLKAKLEAVRRAAL